MPHQSYHYNHGTNQKHRCKKVLIQLTSICPKLAIEALEKDEKYVQI